MPGLHTGNTHQVHFYGPLCRKHNSKHTLSGTNASVLVVVKCQAHNTVPTIVGPHCLTHISIHKTLGKHHQTHTHSLTQTRGSTSDLAQSLGL